MSEHLSIFDHPLWKRRLPHGVLPVSDPDPQPLGCPCGVTRPGESPEQRAFRRFPINSHKPAR